MLRRLTPVFFALACAAAVAACSSSTATPTSGGVPGIGPNFVPSTIYVTDTTQNAIEIYPVNPKPSSTPQYGIGGGNTSINGPEYLAFTTGKLLYVTNYNPATSASSVLAFQEFATGNVLPFASQPLSTGIIPHGIATLANNGGFVVAETVPGGFFTSQVAVFGSSGTNTIAGSSTTLSNPIGVAADASNTVYVANSGNATITTYLLPTPSPTASGSPTPTPTATPSTTPTASSSASPTPTPTATPVSQNFAPTTTISCTCFSQPTGLALDGSGNLFVTDPDHGTAPAVYVFGASQITAGSITLTPTRTITGALTGLLNPTDVKVDSSGDVYVVDAENPPALPSMLLIFSPTANGNVAPTSAVALPAGSATGIALSP